MEVDSHNHVFTFHRGQRPILCFDGDSGEIIGSWGDGMFTTAHGLDVDADDNIWVTDNGNHTVTKFSHDGALLMTLGTKDVPGQDAKHFSGPTDVTVAPNGDIYVTDGYGNSRVAQFDKNGKFIREWGQRGKGSGEFHTPHGIAIDNQGRIYIADRENIRMQVFDLKGKFLKEWKSEALGRPWGVDFASDGHLFMADGGDLSTDPPVRNRIVKLHLEGNVVAKWSSFGSHDGQLYLGARCCCCS